MNNYSITFKSLRAGTVYTVNIGGGTGAAIPLKGGAQPFTTQEDDSDDMFTPIRTQTGYIRIVDDDKAADGTTAFDWKDLIPATDTSRPVSLTDGYDNVVWQGFMQAQSFSGVLYGNPQEREFPVQCVLSVLSTKQVKTDVTSYKNFAYLLDYIFSNIPNYSNIISQIVIQGGSNARIWLRKKLDWRNFMNISDGDVSANYNLFQILEDVCRYWGWTARTYGQQIIFCSADNKTAEPKALILTRYQLESLGSGNSGNIGTDTYDMYSDGSVGNNFASTNNEEVTVRGYSKAVVKADCNSSQSEMEFAPQSLRDILESYGYTWHASTDNPMVGLFATSEISSFTSEQTRVMSGSSTSDGGFSRRQIYTEENSQEPDIVDCIDIRGSYNGTAKASIESTFEMSFPGGSFDIKGTIYEAYVKTEFNNEHKRRMKMAIGIGKDRADVNTKWLNIELSNDVFSLTWGTYSVFDVMVKNVPTLMPCVYKDLPAPINDQLPYALAKIPVSSNLSGRVFVDFYGSPDVDGQRIGKPNECNFEIADFTISFSRDAVSISGDARGRTAIRRRLTSREYSSAANMQASDTYNVDCIFASDNEMDYGYGLLMNENGSFMEGAPIGSGGGNNTIPEQYLANRIATFYNKSRQKLTLELNNESITPRNTAFEGAFYPIAISRDWRDDILFLTLIEL